MFLVRYHSGQNLGVCHYEIFKEMTNNALELLAERENFYASRIPSHKLMVKVPKKSAMRTRGRITGIRGGTHVACNRDDGNSQGPREDWSTSMWSDTNSGTETEAEVIINKRRQTELKAQVKM